MPSHRAGRRAALALLEHPSRGIDGPTGPFSTAGVDLDRLSVVVLLNPDAGRPVARDVPAAVLDAFARRGLSAEVRVVAARRLHAAAREAARAGADAVVAAGGDGTVNAVAGGLVGTRVPLGVLPLGTLNHLARDAGIPLDLDDAVGVAARGETRDVDVGDVNGRVFLNNASLGLYPRLVRLRERARALHGHSRLRATAYATARMTRTFPRLDVSIDVDGDLTTSATPFVFVGNNRYRTDLVGLGRRFALDRGELSVAYADDAGLAATLGYALRGAAGRLESARGLVTRVATDVRVGSFAPSLSVAVDGEVVRLVPPLVFRSRPGALPLLAPEVTS